VELAQGALGQRRNTCSRKGVLSGRVCGSGFHCEPRVCGSGFHCEPRVCGILAKSVGRCSSGLLPSLLLAASETSKLAAYSAAAGRERDLENPSRERDLRTPLSLTLLLCCCLGRRPPPSPGRRPSELEKDSAAAWAAGRRLARAAGPASWRKTLLLAGFSHRR
jgi:hypothetical protein